MKRIHVLSQQTSNKIAAGEVVERPYSVVKELVENSIDAESKNICIEIYDGGQESIKVSDDGIGIHPEDIEKAFNEHATSKIKEIADIYSINTLGFRGEALASIASVSNVVLKTKTKYFDFGKEISISGGNINYIKEIGCSNGTAIEVNDLFYNVPARQKFLKSAQREAVLISDMLTRIAIVNSDISFKYYKNGKKSFITYANDNVLENIRILYGKEVYNNIISFEKHIDIASVHGYVGNAEISRGSRNRQSIFVNKRLIKSKLITAAVENAFKSFLTINKFPFFILFIDIFPEYIDVNVHPTKSEIKFQQDKVIFKLVFDAVHEALRNSLKESFNINNDFPSIEKNNSQSTTISQIPIDLKSPSKEEHMNKTLIKETKSVFENTTDKNTKPNITSNIEQYIRADAKSLNYENTILGNNTNSNTNTTVNFPELKIIGQFNSTYIIAESYDTLYIVDQHAAHEKILFEKFRKGIANNSVVSQMLVTPLVKEMTPEEFVIYAENSDIFTDTGFNIEIFGENTIAIREVPVILGKPDLSNLFEQIVDNLRNMGTGKTTEVKYDVIAKMACKAAIKAHDKLSLDEMARLIDDLRECDDPFTCPHGRPTIIKFTLNELEKKFKRIQ
ncbi:DNA mismatch repair protein MutL [Clostridium tepidiprofundi DSM 19306]|uniref:DNA mismatch repair protein MutL n=1 Tax=Clostridium tepidiprofundi DSM 19306 TaxID=1121338 RepID=A0A151B792_9CLOT|nr:DNA mismatch repair endonuclease MutL [Clostridium tepidiprofundi]KYH35754.1 DNA mismatch repair protein MutL [Clostridium tepidiprofundi DSM 19306]